MHLRYLRHLNATPLIATVFRHRDDYVKSAEPHLASAKVIWLRGEHFETPHVNNPRLDDKAWINAKNVISRIRRAVQDDIAANNVPLVVKETGRIWIEQLAPESHTDWWADKSSQPPTTLRFLLPLETNLGAVVYAGGQGLHLEVGQLWHLNTRAVHSMLNMGAYPMTTLHCEFAAEDGA